jgi:phosphopantetheinyl transferase
MGVGPPQRPRPAPFCYWTAKEAVLKTGGEGIKNLSRCRIREVPDEAHLLVDYRGTTYPVEQIIFDEHVASVAGIGLKLEWVQPT